LGFWFENKPYGNPVVERNKKNVVKQMQRGKKRLTYIHTVGK
jgi:hypothetical protein